MISPFTISPPTTRRVAQYIFIPVTSLFLLFTERFLDKKNEHFFIASFDGIASRTMYQTHLNREMKFSVREGVANWIGMMRGFLFSVLDFCLAMINFLSVTN